MSNSILSRRERAKMQDLIAQPHDARQTLRAYALLWLDDGESVPEVAQRLGVTRQTVYNWASRFQARTNLDLALRLSDAPRCGRPCTATGIIDPLIDSIIERDPREFDYRSTVWTASL
jgi:transposase